MAIILGIDPGSRVTGYGLINVVGNKLEYVGCGCIRTQTQDLPQRLQIIHAELVKVIEQFSPQQSAVEEVFMGRNASAALKLGQARGAAMVACLSNQLPLAEYSARKVKQAVVGNGAADKAQVQHMVKALLSISDNIAEDASDALAVAICHANTQAGLIRMAGAQSFSRKRLR
ncbi:MAG TPA: crossover junction endodeoxyribonuclease RuvC [Gammaproteobacteria bacterium]|jgi:crossover junction endodeoxyribonuclease RuvC|nr:crossover junction endodeoxyribonuclease RuvC [Gammaproteobacteria bacterium]HAT27284.1 crossover junction endodeoxyribonuclease RuvC [Gammaproteobacteria bacterium]HIF87732.1 crossover junction endodeoxyribonuclease RuvC [Gammaproteobacteria bacterium]HIL62061.1 crossover junction endodeoxyribonuclease RuvC [Porticoccaceae bacterium]|tara:strand:- start:26996 stop:27514 length:519 start_codon:yes stop_codon:yes gene_type:complete